MAEALSPQDSAPIRAAAGAGSQYSLAHKLSIVRRRLEKQALFDNKLHKNDQLWDVIIADFFREFPDQNHRTKQSIRNQWTKQSIRNIRHMIECQPL